MADLEHTWHVKEVPVEDIPQVAYLVYKTVYDTTPVKSGNMRSYTFYDYSIEDKTITVGNECVYAMYQDTETAYTGWFEASCNKAYEIALAQYINYKSQDLTPGLKAYFQRMLDKLLDNIL